MDTINLYIFLQLFIHPLLKLNKFIVFFANLLGIREDGYTGYFSIADEFFKKRAINNYYSQFNGQTMVLEYLLNHPLTDEFPEATITIEDANRTPKLRLYNKGEQSELVYLFNKDEHENSILLYNKSEYDAEVDFIVIIDLETITESHEKFIASVVDRYKLASKTYKIITDE